MSNARASTAISIIIMMVALAKPDDKCQVTTLQDAHGVVHTPNFPRPFSVPIFCRWIISSLNSDAINPSITAFLTQMYVSTGVDFIEYAYYESESNHFGKNVIHRVTESNVTRTKMVRTFSPYLVIEFRLDRLEGNHLRVLDGFLDVFGFNITYEIGIDLRNDACTVGDCSFTGLCFATRNFESYFCQCFPGYSGSSCRYGPLCLEHSENQCLNGGECRHVGMTSTVCQCLPTFSGDKCEMESFNNASSQNQSERLEIQCIYDGNPKTACSCQKGFPVYKDKYRHESTIKINKANMLKNDLGKRESFANGLEKFISKHFRPGNGNKIDNLLITNITSSGLVTFYFVANKDPNNQLSDVLMRLYEKGRVGNVSLIPADIQTRQTASLFLMTTELNQMNPVREEDEFSLSCVARGSQTIVFRWYKDGMLVNTSISVRNIWIHEALQDTKDQFISVLGVGKASYLDRGKYTCQVVDFGLEQCKSTYVSIQRPPQLTLDPMSLTLSKGQNTTIKCTSSNDSPEARFGYSWTKNNNLFPIDPDREVWEELYPSGSILRIYNIQKSATYTCTVQSKFKSDERSVRVEVSNETSTRHCVSERHMDVDWPKTAAGIEVIRPCPLTMSNHVTRMCVLKNGKLAQWNMPNFQRCVAEQVERVRDSFRSLTYGFQNTTITQTLTEYLSFLVKRDNLYPGEGETILAAITEVLDYVKKMGSSEYYHGVYFKIIDRVLTSRFSLLDQQKIEQIQRGLRDEGLKWFDHAPKICPKLKHESYESYNVDIVCVERISSQFQNVNFPLRSLSYPSWFSSKVNVRFDSVPKEHLTNASDVLIIFVEYKNLSDFLPAKHISQYRENIDVQCEIVSPIVSIDVTTSDKVSIDLELFHNENSYSLNDTDIVWNLTCAVADFGNFLHPWDLTACVTKYVSGNFTRCTCPQAGTFAIFKTQFFVYSPMEMEVKDQRYIVLIGCMICFVACFITVFYLMLMCCKYRHCLLFLRIQCSACICACAGVFLSTTNFDINEHLYLRITTTLELLLLTSLSSHLSKVLIVYTELEKVRLQKGHQTIICVATGLPILTVLASHVICLSLNLKLTSWWLTSGSLIYVIFVLSTGLIVALYVIVYVNVIAHLMRLNRQKGRVVNERMVMVNCSALIFTLTVAVIITSIAFVNTSHMVYRYAFSIFSANLGLVIFISYVLRSEHSLYSYVTTKIKSSTNLDEAYCSEASNPLNFYTKHEQEFETESFAPPRYKTKLASEHHVTVIMRDIGQQPNTAHLSQVDTNVDNKFTNHCDIVKDACYFSENINNYAHSPKKYTIARPSIGSNIRPTGISVCYLRDCEILPSSSCGPPVLGPESLPQDSNVGCYCEPTYFVDPEQQSQQLASNSKYKVVYTNDLMREPDPGSICVRNQTEVKECPSESKNVNLDRMLTDISQDLSYLLSTDDGQSKQIKVTSSQRVPLRRKDLVCEKIEEETEIVDDI